MRGDPDNLYQRLTNLRQPIFLAFGSREPYIPSTALNGLTDLGNQVVNPFLSRMVGAGNEPVVKIYPDVGHFIHTDEPVQFPVDVAEFVLRGRVSTATPLAVDRLFHDAPAAAAAPAASTAPKPPPGLRRCSIPL
ncbi:MAG: hypothetical protein ACJ8H8_32690 [Geminicoccaceae bacterium]